jgi:DNA-binding Lrp family transcriptional regulator
MKECDIKILSALRNNSRQTLTKISKQIKIPVSTIYDRIKINEGNTIKKHTSILDFPKIGYNIRLYLLIKTNKKDLLRDFLKQHQNVNSCFMIEGEYNFIVDCIFREMIEMQKFMESIENKEIDVKQIHYVTDEITRENFMNGGNYNEFFRT